MKLLHPFMPFITEEIWQSLPHEGESIVVSRWPIADPARDYPEDEASMELLISAIRAIRNRRAEMNVPPSKKAHLYVVTARPELFDGNAKSFFVKLASASEVELVESYASDKAVQIVTESATLYIPLADMIDLDKELERLNREKANLEKEIARLEGKLSNAGFVYKAPAAVIEGEREKLKKYRDTLAGTEAAIAAIGR